MDGNNSRIKVSHEKKNPNQLKSHAYTKDDLKDMLTLASTGVFKHSDLCARKKIPRSTFSKWTTGKTKTNERGPHKIFSKKNEQHLADYVNTRFDIGIPISVPTFKRHLKGYLSKRKMINPFHRDNIGRGWMRRFIRDYNPKFVSKGKESKECQKPKDFTEWTKKRNEYILKENENDFFMFRDQIIMLDSETVECPVDSSVSFDMMNVYTAAGTKIKSFVVHDGVIPVALLNKYTGPLSFIKSTSGKLSDTCIKIAFNHIERSCISLDVPFPVIVYLTPKIWEKLDLFAWNSSLKRNFILYSIPSFIHNIVKFSNMTAFQRIIKITKQVTAKSKMSTNTTLDVFLNAYTQAVTDPKMETRYRSHCRRCRIVTVKKLSTIVQQGLTYEREDDIEIEDSEDVDSN